VEGGGFEPPKVEPADLQSAPFDRSGTPPKIKPHILLEHSATVNHIIPIRRIFLTSPSRAIKPAIAASGLQFFACFTKQKKEDAE
jgi:hypothetical protein